MRVRWSNKAKQDMEHHIEYIAADSPDAALNVQDAIYNHVDHLAEHPKLAKPGRVKNTRELVNAHFSNYIVVYMIRDDNVIVLRVLHAAQQWPPE
jgi:toxin ParE1/3/4